MSNETPSPTPDESYRPYEDPEILESSMGDKGLLNRLVALKLAELSRFDNPDDPQSDELYSEMAEEVHRYRDENNLWPRGDTPGTPE